MPSCFKINQWNLFLKFHLFIYVLGRLLMHFSWSSVMAIKAFFFIYVHLVKHQLHVDI